MTNPSLPPLHVDALSPTARSLALGAIGFQELASSAPSLPNAGASTSFVGDALIALAHTLGVAADVETSAADNVSANGAGYESTEEDSSDSIKRVGTGLPDASADGNR